MTTTESPVDVTDVTGALHELGQLGQHFVRLLGDPTQLDTVHTETGRISRRAGRIHMLLDDDGTSAAAPFTLEQVRRHLPDALGHLVGTDHHTDVRARICDQLIHVSRLLTQIRTAAADAVPDESDRAIVYANIDRSLNGILTATTFLIIHDETTGSAAR